MIFLHYPLPGAKLSLRCDASLSQVGAILQQELPSGDRVPISCFSKSLNPAQRKYSTFDRELLAVYLATKHFRYFIEGQDVVAYTDHKPLVHALTKNRDASSARQDRHLSYISQFIDSIEYIKGDCNFLPDLLSRKLVAAIAKINPGISMRDIALAQQTDEEILNLTSKNYSLNYGHVCIDSAEGLYLLCDMQEEIPKPLCLCHSVNKSSSRATHFPTPDPKPPLRCYANASYGLALGVMPLNLPAHALHAKKARLGGILFHLSNLYLQLMNDSPTSILTSSVPSLIRMATLTYRP